MCLNPRQVCPPGFRMPRLLRFLLLLLLLAVAWQLLRPLFVQHEREIRSQVRETAQQTFPRLAAEAGRRYGLQRLAPAEAGMSEVVLVHGLDDPGKVWMNLAPALRQAGYGVSALDYPNDQPITESAAFLQQQLRLLASQGVAEVDLVVHSMGGLVAREMLTSPALACDPPACRMPVVRRLIMIGTPNHGSQLARLRGLAEVREQLERSLNGDAGWLDWVFDGAGEAGLDLIPGSDFLATLNARPHPPHTAMVVIAGVIGEQQLQALQHIVDGHWPGNGGYLADQGPHVGDGLVSLESARLPGVPLHRVPGNHLSIIRNVRAESTRVPPAVPLVLSLLEN